MDATLCLRIVETMIEQIVNKVQKSVDSGVVNPEMSDAPDVPAAAPASNADGKRKRRMTARWQYTNRLNARASTGPKTDRGKAQVTRNALTPWAEPARIDRPHARARGRGIGAHDRAIGRRPGAPQRAA